MLPENYKRVLRELILPGLKILQENPRATTLEIPGRGSLPIEVFEDLVNVSTPDRLKKVFRQTDVGNPTFILALENYIETKLDEEKDEALEEKSPAEVAKEVEIIQEATQKISQTNDRKIEPYKDVYHKQIEAYNRFMQGFPDEMGARIAAYYGPKSSLSPTDQLTAVEITAITTTISNELKQKGPDFKTLGEIEHFINTASSDLLTQSYRQKLAQNLNTVEIEPEVQAVIDEKVEKAIASFKAGPTITDQAQKLHAIVQEKNQIEKRIHKYQTDTIDRSVQISRIIRNLPARFKNNPAFIQKLTAAVSSSQPTRSESQQRTLLETLIGTALEAEDERTQDISSQSSTSTLSTEDILSLKSTAQAVEQRMAPSYTISTTVSQAPPTRPTPKHADENEKIVSESMRWAGDHPEPYAQHVIDDMYVQVEQSEDTTPQHTRRPVSREELRTFANELEDPDTLTRIKDSPEGEKELLVSALKNSLFIPSQRDYEALLVAPLIQTLTSSLSSSTTEAQLQSAIKKTLASWSLPPEYKARINSSIIDTVTQRVTTTLLPLAATFSTSDEEDNQSISSAVLIHALKTHGVFVDDTTFIVKNIHDSGILSSVVGYLQDSSTYTQTMENVVSELQKIVPSRLLPNIPENKAVLEAIAKDMLYRATAFPEVARRLKSSSAEQQSAALQTITTDAYTSHYDDFFDSDYTHVAESIIEDNWEPEDEAEGHHQPHHSLPEKKKKPINKLLDRQLSILDHTKQIWGEYGTTSFFFTQAANTRRGKVVGFFVDTLSIIPGVRETILTLYFSFNEPGLTRLHGQIQRDQRLLQRRIDILQSKGIKGRELELEHLNLKYNALTAQLNAISAIQDKGSKISRLNPLRALFNAWKSNKDPLQNSQLSPNNIAVFQWLRRLPTQFSTFLQKSPFKLSAILPRLSFLELGLKRALNPPLGIVTGPNVFALQFGSSFPRGLSAFGSYFRQVIAVPFNYLRSNVGFLSGIKGFFTPRFKGMLSLASPHLTGLLSGFINRGGSVSNAITDGGNNALKAFFTKKGQWILFAILGLIIIIPMSSASTNLSNIHTSMIDGSQIVLNGSSGPSGPTGPSITPAFPPIGGELRYFSQRESPYAQHPLRGGCTIEQRGCGQTTIAMILATYIDQNYNPISVAQEFYPTAGCPGTSTARGRDILVNEFGFESDTLFDFSISSSRPGKSPSSVARDFKSYIDSGSTILAAARINGIDHIFWVTDVRENPSTGELEIFSYDPWYGHGKPRPINIMEEMRAGRMDFSQGNGGFQSGFAIKAG